MFTQRDKFKAASCLRGRLSAARVLIAVVALGALSAASGCDQVKSVAKSAQEAVQKVIKPKEEPNQNPAPAPAPTEPEPEGPIVLTPGETPPAEPGSPETPADGGAAPGDGGTTTPGTTEPTTPAAPTTPSTPGTTEPTTPGTTTPPSTGGTTTPPATGGATTPTPTTPGDAVDNAASAFANPGAFLYRAVGKLAANSGEGSKDETIYAPGITFPVKNAPAFLNSQVYGVGGMSGAAGSECAAANYGYPWQDNFCEKRAGSNRASYNCPSKQIHQGQDIRAGDSAFCTKVKKMPTAEREGVEIVAVEDGVIQYIGSYTVDLGAGGRIYRYLHMNMKKLKVKLGDTVNKGQTIGYMSNDFGVDSAGKPVATTLHLHFEVKQNMQGIGWTWVSPYMSLVTAYKVQHPDGALTQ